MVWKKFCGVKDFSYLNKEFLKSLDTKSGATILTSEEKGKVIDNFECYLACMMDTEKASVAKVGDNVTLRLPSTTEVDGTIEYIVEEDDNRILDVIWWNYKGLKVSNLAILEENDISYVERSKAGYIEKIYVKILRQNDTYSIVENYTDEQLLQLGFDEESVNKRKQLNLYDEILLH